MDIGRRAYEKYKLFTMLYRACFRTIFSSISTNGLLACSP
jgi:hypothetical protein